MLLLAVMEFCNSWFWLSIIVLAKLLFLGSFHTASKHPLPIWYDTAKLVFNQTKEEKFVKQRGVYDKLIIDCAFRENLRRKRQPTDEGGCEGFHPSLTTNGLCYTFNGEHSSDIWKHSEMMTTFSHLFPSKTISNKTFGGSRTVQGKRFSFRREGEEGTKGGSDRWMDRHSLGNNNIDGRI